MLAHLKTHIDSQGDMFYVLGDGCLDAVVKKGDVDLRWKIFSGKMEFSQICKSHVHNDFHQG